MRYLKTYEEINWPKLNPFKDKHAELMDKMKKMDILSKCEQIEDCLQDLRDIGVCSKTFNGGSPGTEILIYNFRFKNGMTKQQSDDFNQEIFGRISDIDPNIKCYHERWYTPKETYIEDHKVKSSAEMDIRKVTFIFTYMELKKDRLSRIFEPWKYGSRSAGPD